MEILETIMGFIAIMLFFSFPMILFYMTILFADIVDKQSQKEKEERKAPNNFMEQFMKQ